MRFVRQRLAEILFIQHLYCRSIVRAAQLILFVVIVQSLCADCFKVNRVADFIGNIGLAATVDTAAGARHYLYEGVILFAALYLLDNLSRIAETVCDSNFNYRAADIVFGFLNALGAADFLKLYGSALAAEFVSRRS